MSHAHPSTAALTAGATTPWAAMSTIPSIERMAKLVGEAIRTMAPAYVAIRRMSSDTVMNGMEAAFQALVGHAKVVHDFTIEILGFPYDAVHCRVGITCGDINVAQVDASNLGTTLATYFAHPLNVTIEDGKLEFTLPAAAIL